MNVRPGQFACRVAAIAAAMSGLLALVPDQAVAQTKVTDKWITIVLPAEPPDLEPCNTTRSYQGRVLKQNVAETLVQKTPEDGSLQPRLATSWQKTDPTTWRFKLREGVTFHDGAPFNAEAVKRSIERSLLSPSPVVCNVRAQYFGDLKLTVTAIDPYTVQIVTDKPDPILPIRLATLTIAGPNMPAGQLSLAPVGTGPYVFDSWRAGQEVLLKRNDNYWGKKPPVEGARFIWRSESSVRASMVEIGEADFTPFIAVQEVKNPKTDISYLDSNTTFMRIDTTRPPLNDIRVRRALNLAIDRESIRTNILSKDFLHATQIVMPAIPGHNFELDKKVIGFDPAKARALLAEAKAAGVPIETEILLLNQPAYYPQATEIGEAIMGMYRAVGLNIKFQNLEPAEYSRIHNRPFNDARGPTLLMSQHDNNSGDPVFSVVYKYACNGSTSMYCDAALDKEIDRVSGLEGEARVKGWQEVFRQLYDDVVPNVWMYHMVVYSRVGSKVNIKPDVTFGSEFRIEEVTFK